MDLIDEEGIALYTDGSCHWQTRSGGWAWIAVDHELNEHRRYGSATDATSNRMELTAVIDGLKALHEHFGATSVLVHSDSEYVILGASKPSRKRMKNKDLWAEMDEAIDLHDHVEFVHVRGHQGDKYNEMAHTFAWAARKGA